MAGKVWLSIVTAGMLALAGCGGGTISTEGASSVEFEGVVRSVQGAPLAEVEVVNIRTGDSARTDSLGNFTLRTEVVNGEVELLVSGNNLGGTVKVTGLPSGDATAKVELRVDSTDGAVSVELLELQESEPAGSNGGNAGGSDDSPSDEPQNSGQDNDPSAGNQVDGYRLNVQGRVVLADGKPAGRAALLLDPQKVRVTADREGYFNLSAANISDSITFHLSFLGHRASVRISGVPQDSDAKIRIVMRLKYSSKPGTQQGSGRFSIEVSALEIERG